MGGAEGSMGMALLHYTLNPRFAVGPVLEWDDEDDERFAGIQANWLIERWNMPRAQANAYLRVAAGGLRTFGEGVDPAGMVGLTLDAEDRRVFVRYENMAMFGGPDGTDFRQSFRVGVAPYLGEMGDLHTWLMLQLDHAPEAHDPLTLTPVVRLFQGRTLVEFGVSDEGEAHVHLEIRF